jgi:hypothetical protein
VVRKGSIQDATFITSDPGRSSRADQEEKKLELVEAKMDPGQRKGMSIILDINSMIMWMLSMD